MYAVVGVAVLVVVFRWSWRREMRRARAMCAAFDAPE